MASVAQYSSSSSGPVTGTLSGASVRIRSATRSRPPLAGRRPLQGTRTLESSSDLDENVVSFRRADEPGNGHDLVVGIAAESPSGQVPLDVWDIPFHSMRQTTYVDESGSISVRKAVAQSGERKIR